MNIVIHAAQATFGVCLALTALTLAIATLMIICGVFILLCQMIWDGIKALWAIARGKK